MDLIVLFPVENYLGNRFPAGILRKSSEIGVGLLLLPLTSFRTDNLTSSSQKWQPGISDLVERAAPYWEVAIVILIKSGPPPPIF